MNDVLEGLLSFPPRPDGAPTGSEFAGSILRLPLGEEREEAIKAQLLAGNVPSWSRQGLAVPVSSGGHTGVFFALPDYLSVGSDEDFVRVPMNPLTATVVADAVGASLVTRAMVNAVWEAAQVKLVFKNLPPTAEMTSTKWFVDHNQIVQGQIPAHDGIIAGHKKDVVLCLAFQNQEPYPRGHGDRVAIYGWCAGIGVNGDWVVIQPLNASSHNNKYADYSHGIRLVAKSMLVDNEYRDVIDVLHDPELAGLLSDEGHLPVARYHGT